ncbi:MAG TPA: PEP/pyruvate-binding domain-containing protein [Gemmataceae bacterium]
MPLVLRGTDASPDVPLGGKARALAALRDAGLPIPPWVVVLPRACDPHRPEPSPELRAELAAALAELCPAGEPVAVRSSASDEDGAQHSFAGQLDTFLFVPPADVPEKVAAVWRSGFSDRIVAYRKEHGLDPAPRPPAVLVQRMVVADAAGVAFGADPVSGRRGVAVVAAVYGLGTALVAGDADADTWHVERDGTISKREIADKRTAHRAAPGQGEGVTSVPVPEDKAKQPALTDEQVRAVAELVRRTGKHFGRPQDIEWAVEAGKLYLLQSRPITSLAGVADPDGVPQLWDNSNIAESYNGVTTPLTFSFARTVYEAVYRQFCLILRVPPAAMERNADIFPRMLGLVRGRVYYNLLNWYRLLTLLPGFTANRAFMEQMMGVKEGLPDAVAADLEHVTWRDRWRDRLRLAGSVTALVRQHFALPRQVKRFYARLDDALGPGRPDLAPLRPDELVSQYRDLERKLLTKWDAPLVNDFLAMIFYGVLGKLAKKWCGDEAGTLQNDLLCGEGGMISAEPAARVKALAEIARGDAKLTDALCNGSLAAINAEMARGPAFREGYRAYLDKFGDRCLEELKLESPTLHDDPLLLLRSIGQLAHRIAASGYAKPGVDESDLRHRAEERARAALRFRPLRRLIFRWVLRHARGRVRDRENLRFERTRLFGRVRSLFVELGRRFYALDLLEQPRDVFYLELNEALGFVGGTVTCTDLKGLVALRKAEFERYRDLPPPADRFETRGIVYQGNDYQGEKKAADVTGDRLQGLGCCPGVVRGPVRVVTDPRHATLTAGDILVAERTDPGWIMLFPSAAGLLVERGSLLSHSAIVAREMGIPAIVSLAGVTRWLKDGDRVELNGSTGVVVRLNGAGHGQ